jgi:hypothetical protein
MGIYREPANLDLHRRIRAVAVCLHGANLAGRMR